MSNKKDFDEFAARTGSLLRASADQLDPAVQTRLARVRAAALREARQPRWLAFSYLVPAGALASAALVALLFMDRGTAPVPMVEGGSALNDLELLVDADSWELVEETDLEFIEWAAAVGAQQGEAGG